MNLLHSTKMASAVLVVFTLASVTARTANAPDEMQTPQKIERKISKTIQSRYLLYLPKDYSPRGKKQWPLLLFLHGAGERGTNLTAVAVHGPPKLVKQRKDFPFIIVSPQCPNGEIWSNEVLLNLLDDVLARHRVDPRRVYLTGLSMGGYGTWSLITQHPERFAAAAPICGGGEAIRLLLPDGARKEALKSLPVWAFHGAKDPVVKLEESERMVNALKKLGNPEVDLTVYPEAGHDSWTEAYNNGKLYEWLLKHERQPAKK